MSRIVDALNEVLEVATWTESPEPFFVVRFEKSDNTDGFDWVELNGSGKIISHHGIGLTHATHFADNESASFIKKDSKNANRVQENLAKEFNVYSVTQDTNTKYTSQQWLHFPSLNTDVNLKLKVSGDDLGSNITFDLPTGIQMSYNTEGDIYENIASCSPIPVKNNLKLRIRATSAIGESTIIVRDMCENYIGELGVFAYDKKKINVKLWTIISDPNGKTDADKLLKRGNELMLKNERDPITKEYTTKELINLKDDLKRIYAPYNIDFNITTAAKHITYDPKAAVFKSGEKKLLDGDLSVNFDNVNLFFDEIEKQNKASFEKGFIHVIIAQFDCENRSSKVLGFGQIGGNLTLIFNTARIDYGVYAHEIGHNFNLRHSFQDKSSNGSLSELEDNTATTIVAKDNAVMDILDKEYKLPEDSTTVLSVDEQEKYEEIRKIRVIEIKDVNDEKLTDEEKKKLEESRSTSKERRAYRMKIHEKYYDAKIGNNKEVDNLIDNRREIYNGVDKVLYTEKGTENVMDYTGIYNFFVKWQWKIIREAVNKK